jgi:hypothetical protein
VATNHSMGQPRRFSLETGDFKLEREVSPASQAPLIQNGHGSQGSQNLALGLTTTVPMNRDSMSLFAGFGFWGKALTRLMTAC